MTRCPSCSSTRIYPSRLRSAIERVRRALTERQPYRCHACGYRAWSDIVVPVDTSEAGPDDLRTGVAAKPITPTDLERLDNGSAARRAMAARPLGEDDFDRLN